MAQASYQMEISFSPQDTYAVVGKTLFFKRKGTSTA